MFQFPETSCVVVAGDDNLTAVQSPPSWGWAAALALSRGVWGQARASCTAGPAGSGRSCGPGRDCLSLGGLTDAGGPGPTWRGALNGCNLLSGQLGPPHGGHSAALAEIPGPGTLLTAWGVPLAALASSGARDRPFGAVRHRGAGRELPGPGLVGRATTPELVLESL